MWSIPLHTLKDLSLRRKKSWLGPFFAPCLCCWTTSACGTFEYPGTCGLWPFPHLYHRCRQEKVVIYSCQSPQPSLLFWPYSAAGGFPHTTSGSCQPDPCTRPQVHSPLSQQWLCHLKISADDRTPCCTWSWLCRWWCGIATAQFPGVACQALWHTALQSHELGSACQVVADQGSFHLHVPQLLPQQFGLDRIEVLGLSREEYALCSRCMIASSSPKWGRYANCRGSWNAATRDRRCPRIHLFMTFMTWEVSATGL